MSLHAITTLFSNVLYTSFRTLPNLLDLRVRHMLQSLQNRMLTHVARDESLTSFPQRSETKWRVLRCLPANELFHMTVGAPHSCTVTIRRSF